MILFWHETGKNGCFSNWYHAEFNADNRHYITSEQYMMAHKAMLFHDDAVLDEILHETDQKKTKALGRKVHNFDSAVWNANRETIMHDGVYAKFTQNENLKKILLAAGDQIIAEASPWDKIWGIGMYASNPDAQDPEKWKGKNLLGKALMKVREEIREKEAQGIPLYENHPLKEEKPGENK